MDVREIDDRYPEYARPYEPTGQGRPHGALPWGLAAGFVLILLSALLSFTPAPPPAPAPEPSAVVPVPEPTPTPPEPPIIIPDDPPEEPPEPPFIPDDPPEEPPTPPPTPPETVRYTVTFVNWDGSVLSRREYDEGTAASAVIRPATPTRPSDGSFAYTFSGWSPDIRAVTGNITYTALYSSTPVAPRYTVTFVNWDGAQISSRQYDEGTAVSGIVVPADPTRPSDGSFRYIFYGWTPDLAPVTADATYTAVYLTEELPSYNITFVDWDGSVLLAATPYTEGTPASDIAVPADPTRADTAEYTYSFAGWSPDLAEVTADATYTATYTQAPRTYTAPTIELVHELNYYDGWDDYLVDFTATVTPNDVAGASGQLKLRHYNAQTGAWEWTPLSGDASEMLSGAAYVQLYSVKGSERRELVPSDYNALYDIPEDAEGIEATITWRFPWYTDDDGDVMMKIREVMNLSFDYTLPNGEEGTVALSDDFYLYNDWFFDRIEEPQADATEKTITFYYTYEVEYGGPLNYDNLYWHPHLYDHATGAELDMTPTITRVVEADGTVGDKIVYTFDTLVPGQQYDFTAEVVYSDYGVDDADHWDNWVSTHHTYSPVGFDVEDGKYTITWKDPDGLIIDTTTVDPGETPTHEDPELWPTEQYTYTFTGWSPDIVPATENATYTAQCTQTLRQYPVVFMDEDGSTVLKEETLYDYGTPASDIVQPATPTKPSDASNDYTFAGWDPEIEEVTEDATYTATYTATPRTYTAPSIDLEHVLDYFEDSDEYFVGFTTTVTLNDVAGSTGQLKVMHYNFDTGAWDSEELGDGEMTYGDAVVKLYTVKDGARTELTPSDLNASYDIPEDAESLEAEIVWHIPWYYDSPQGFCFRVREIMNVAFDYELPNGETGTVELADDFYVYRDWFFGIMPEPELDTAAKTITLYYPYQVDHGGPLNYDNIYWHPHLSWQEESSYNWDHNGTELDITPEITHIEKDGQTVAKIVYTLDELVEGRVYDFEAQVIYSDYGVDDADHWDNWVCSVDEYRMKFEIPDYVAPEIGDITGVTYTYGSAGNRTDFQPVVTLNDVAGSTGRLKLLVEDPDNPGTWNEETLGDSEVANAADFEYFDGSDWVALAAPSDLNAEYDIPAGAESLRADMIRNLVPPGGYGAMRVKAKVAFDYTLPDGETGTVESNEFFLYRGSFAERNGSPAPVLDRDARTITMDFNYHLVEGGEIDPAKVTWTEHHLYGKDKGDTGEGYGTEITGLTPEVTEYDEGGVHHVVVKYTLDSVNDDWAYSYVGTVYDDEWGDSSHWNNWEVNAYQIGMEFESPSHIAPTIGIYSSAEYGGDSGDWHFGIGIVGSQDIPEDLRDGKARLKFERYDEDAGAWVDIEFISAADWEANEAKPWDDPTKEEIGDRQMFGSDTVYTYKEGDDSSVAVSTLADPTAMIELNGSDTIYASMMYHLPLNHTWEPASTLIRPVLDYEYPDGTTGTVEGNPIRVFSGSFVDENGAVTDADAKTITVDFIYDGGPYAIDPDNANWGHSLHWQDVSDGSYSTERYKDDPDDTHGWVAAEPTMETYAGTDGKTHVRITYTLDEISTDYAYDYLGTVYYFPELEGESGMWEAFPTQNYIRFN